MVGLDPHLESIPKFIFESILSSDKDEIVEIALREFNKIIIESVADLIPTIKIQIAFYEQYGIPGLKAFKETIRVAKEHGLLVVVDGKRNDIGFTSEAYANAFLGKTNILGSMESIFDADALTVTPYLGSDGLIPFVNVCKKYGKGIFILVKTSNPSSGEFQDQILKETDKEVYQAMAKVVNELGKDLIGEKGYSSVGAVVGATYPEQASVLRNLMPNAIILVPGYGAQGGTAKDTLPCFNEDTMGAIIHSSRGIIFTNDLDMSKEEYSKFVRGNIEKMILDINSALSN